MTGGAGALVLLLHRAVAMLGVRRAGITVAVGQQGGAPPGDRPGDREGPEDPRPAGAPRHRMRDRHRRLRVRSGERRLYRISMRLLHLHGRRLRPQPDRDGAPTKAFEPSLFVWATGDEPPDRGPRDRRRRPQGAGFRFRSAARLGRARRHLRARLRRARQACRRPWPAVTSVHLDRMVRINDQWRVIFIWSGGDADEVRIVDYH
jgi:hypothetical protein